MRLLVLAALLLSPELHWKLLRWLPPGPSELRRQVARWLHVTPDMPEGRLRVRPEGLVLEHRPGSKPAVAHCNFAQPQGWRRVRLETRASAPGRLTVHFGLSEGTYELQRDWRPLELPAYLPYPSEDANLSLQWNGAGRAEFRRIRLEPGESEPAPAAAETATLLAPGYRAQMPPGETRFQVTTQRPGRLQLELLGPEGEKLDAADGWSEAGVHQRSARADRVGHYRWRFRLRDGAWQESEFDVLPASDREWWTVRDGRLFRNGQGFFPVGLYLRRPTLEAARELGLNTAIPTDRRWDAMHEPGIRLILEGTEDLQRTSEEMQVLAWTFTDEPDLNPDQAAGAQSNYQRFRRQDPYHPVYTTCHTPRAYGAVAAHTDILAIDPYPVATVARPLWTVANTTDQARRAAGPGRCVVLVNQAFGLNPLWNRVPTPAEERVMTYLALNHGAGGLIFYVETEILWGRGRNLRFHLKEDPLWPEIQREAREIRELEPFLLGARPEPLGTGAVDASRWTLEGRQLTCLVNTSRHPQRFRGLRLAPLEVRCTVAPAP